MGNDNGTDINVALGQLEDELGRVKSAREQVDEVLSASARLAELVRQSDDETKAAADALSKEAARLEECSGMIGKLSAEGVEAIQRQASDSQAALREGAEGIVQKVASEMEQLSALSETIERSSAEGVEAIQKQVADAGTSIGNAAEAVVERVSSESSVLVKQAMASLSEGLDKAERDVDAAAEFLSAAASSVKESADALREAQEAATNDSKRQNAEVKSLIEEAQRHLSDIDERIATLEGIDIDSLVAELKGLKENEESISVELKKQMVDVSETMEAELRGLKKIEEANGTSLKKQMTGIAVMVGICTVVCVAVLVKLMIS